MDYKLTDFRPGMRVSTHPATDYWMMGIRYGTVRHIGRKLIHVQFDVTDKLHTIAPRNLIPID